MPLIVKDRVMEISSTTGTGTITLGGAVTGYQAFSVIGNGNTTYYAIDNGTEWEVGIGTYTASGTTLSRDTVLESSNSGSLVNFSAGVKTVFVTYPAEKSVDTDTAQNLTNKSIDSSPIGGTTPSTGRFTSVTTPSVTATTNDLTLSALSTGNVVVNQGVNGATGLVLSNSALSTASARLFFQNSNGTTSISNVAGNTIEFRTSATIGTTSGAEQFRVSNTASAVNYVQVTGGATGNPSQVVLTAQGSDANVHFVYRSRGTGNHILQNASGMWLFRTSNPTGTLVNYPMAFPSIAGSPSGFQVEGSDTNIDLSLTTKGTGAVNLNTNSGSTTHIFSYTSGTNTTNVVGTGNMSWNANSGGSHRFYTNGLNTTQQFQISHTASAVNYVQVTGGATGVSPSITPQGSDADISLNLTSKGTGVVNILSASNIGRGSTNWIQFSGSGTGSAVSATALGGDTNIDITLTPKGTGKVVITNGIQGGTF